MPSSNSDTLLDSENRSAELDYDQNLSTSHQENFHQLAQSEKFFEAFLSVFDDAVNLEIMTIVENEGDDLKEYINKRNKRKNYEGLAGKRMISTIGLLDGDIQNIIGSIFIKDPDYEKLREFHQQQVIKGHEIIQKNLETLQSAIKVLMEIAQQSPPTQS